MGRGRIIPMLAAVVVLLLRGGNCVPLLLADEQTKDCCHRGKCSPSKDADPCCQTSSAAPVQHFEAADKVSVPALAYTGVVVPPDVTNALTRPDHLQTALLEISPHLVSRNDAPILLPLLI